MAFYKALYDFNPTDDWAFSQGCSRTEVTKKNPSLKFLTYPTIMTLGSYILPKEDPKNI